MHILRFSDLCAQGQAQGKRVFIRADLNVPLNDAGQITEDTRVRASVPAIEMALKAGAAVMVTSHLGRPTEGEFKAEDSLAPVAKRLSELLGREVPLVANWVDGVQVAPGQVVLLENCRVNVGEKKNNEALAKKLAALCDIFVHDAFGTAHRAEGTTYGIAQFAPIACAGPLLSAEIDAIQTALANPARPLAAIVAGSKVSTKLTILQSLAKNVDQLIVGGGIANTFMLAAGLNIGKSLAEPDLVGEFLGRFRPDIEDQIIIGHVGSGLDGGGRVGRKGLGHHHVGGNRHLGATRLHGVHHGTGLGQQGGLGQAFTDGQTSRQHEGVGNAAAYDELIDLIGQALQNRQFGADLAASHDGGQRALGLCQRFGQGVNLG